jgi:hypothetical protein
MSLTYTQPDWLPGDLVTAARLNSDRTNIAQKFGNIVDADVAADAGVQGSKLAAGSTPGDRIAAKTVAQAQLGLLSVGTAELIDLGITKGKITTTAGSRPTLAQLEILVQTASFSGSGVGTIFAVPATAIPTATYQILSYRLSNAPTHGAGSALTLFTSVSGANYIFGVDQSNPGGAFSGNVEIVYIAKT